MMERNILAVIVPVLLIAGAVNTVEIYNEDGNKVDLYGRAVGLHYSSKGSGESGYGGNGDMTCARLGFKGETQISPDLTGYGQWEYNFQGNNSEGAGAQTGNKTRLAFAGLRYADASSFGYSRDYGMVYDALDYTDMLPEFDGDIACNGDFFVSHVGGITTYRSSNFFSLVNGLNFVVQYLGKNECDTVRRPNGDGAGDSISYEYKDFGIAGTCSTADRTNLQGESSLSKGKKTEQWVTGLKHDASSICLAANYDETRNTTPITNRFTNIGGSASETQDVLLVAQHQSDLGLHPSIIYIRSKAKDVEGIGDIDLVNYFEMGATYYFNKDMSTHADYTINQINSDNKLGVGSDDTIVVGTVYQLQ